MSSSMIGLIGLIFSLGLLIWLALRDVNIIFASIVCSLLVLITNGMPLADGLTGSYLAGELGAFTFAARFFLLFVAGAIFGKIMSESHAATSIALAMVRKMGKKHVLLATVMSCALLTYGGVVVFVVIFAMYPLGLRLLKEADIPKRLFCGALALGAGTFTLTALPGTPSIHNIIPTLALGTNLFSAPLLGIFGGLVMLILGLGYLEYERNKAVRNGEGFEPGTNDLIPNIDEISNIVPPWPLACLPLLLVILLIMTPRVLDGLGADLEIISFANKEPVIWPSFALLVGSIFSLAVFPKIRSGALKILGGGTQDAIMPLMATSAVIGFGGVVAQTTGFAFFTQTILSLDLHPMVSMFVSASAVSGITGSSSGGLQIFMSTLAEDYLNLGISPDELHRLAAMASGGLDSLPHCGAVIAMLTITQLTHKEAYKDVGVVTVIVPIIATIATILLAVIF